MYKTGHDLPDELISQRYGAIAHKIGMPTYFYPFVARLVTKVCPAGQVLDIGCGNGYLLKLLARSNNSSLTAFGAEMSRDLAIRAEARLGLEAGLVRGSALALPFRDEQFDVVTMTEVIEHLKDPHLALKEAVRVLKGTGVLVLTIPNMSAYSPWWRLAERLPPGPWQRPFLPGEHPLRTFQPIDTAYLFDEIVELLAVVGVRVRTIWGREYLPYLTVGIPVLDRVYRRLILPWFEPIIGRVLPVRLAYRLFIECTK